MVDDHTGLVRVGFGWIKVELVAATEAPELLESRRSAMLSDLQAEAKSSAPAPDEGPSEPGRFTTWTTTPSNSGSKSGVW